MWGGGGARSVVGGGVGGYGCGGGAVFGYPCSSVHKQRTTFRTRRNSSREKVGSRIPDSILIESLPASCRAPGTARPRVAPQVAWTLRPSEDNMLSRPFLCVWLRPAEVRRPARVAASVAACRSAETVGQRPRPAGAATSCAFFSCRRPLVRRVSDTCRAPRGGPRAWPR